MADGVNFALLCRHGISVHLLLYPLDEDSVLGELVLDPHKNRTGDHWHILVKELPSSFRYGWRVDGPKSEGHRYNPKVILIDPASTALSDGTVWGANTSYFRGAFAAVKGTHRRSLFFRRPFDWREDAPQRTALEDSIIYELHVRGFTVHPSAGVSKPGTFAGVVDKIPYLKDLGVTAVELLPVHEFDEDDCVFTNPKTGEPLRNFWGYNSIAFAAPKAAYAAAGREHGQLYEFREMVRALHEAGIEVILDVVFNHTGEGDDRGRTYSFRGLDNQLYYLMSPDGEYLNFSGCGNTVNCNHPVVRDLILTCLRFWVGDMHVDGLRFDLASVFGRDPHGNVLVEPPIVEMIAEDGLLRDTKLIAEPWDAAGLYQVGYFPYGTWSATNISTTKPTAKTISTATTSTTVGTAASRDRPAARASSGSADARRKTCSRLCFSRRACRCCSPAMNSCARKRATTTPGARTTTSVGSTGGCSATMPTSTVSPAC
jgi:isoamylase